MIYRMLEIMSMVVVCCCVVYVWSCVLYFYMITVHDWWRSNKKAYTVEKNRVKPWPFQAGYFGGPSVISKMAYELFKNNNPVLYVLPFPLDIPKKTKCFFRFTYLKFKYKSRECVNHPDYDLHKAADKWIKKMTEVK